MLVHPSLMIIASLDEREYNAESAPDVKRAFIHLAPTTVRKHEASDPAVNTLALKVNFSKKYWFDADEGAAEMWPVVKDWLKGKRYFVGENIKSFNKSRGERGEQTVDYRRIDLLMAQNTIRIAAEPASELPVLEDFAEQVRAFANAGAFGDGAAVEVQIPSESSLAAQRAAYRAQVEAAQAKAAQDAAQVQDGALEHQGEEAHPGEPALDAAPAEDAPETEGAAEDEGVQDAAPAALEVPPMAIDYTVWGVVASDGSVRAFDSAAGTWL